MKKHCVLFIVFMFLMNATVFAHQMLIEPLEKERIRVRYEDGKFSSDTTVTLFNADGQVVFMKKVDENGEFDYSRYSDVASLMVDDGIGHRLIWKVGEPVNNITGKERWIRIGLVMSAISAIGFAFYERTRRKRLEREYERK